MGLDMYLRARRYVSGWKHNDADEINEWEQMLTLFDMHDLVTDESPHGYVEFCIGYWRKAHDIHQWFVENAQGGVDECQPTTVSRRLLEDLRTECLRFLADHPGSGEEDNEMGWAIYQRKKTVENIDKALSLDPAYWLIVYQSSW